MATASDIYAFEATSIAGEAAHQVGEALGVLPDRRQVDGPQPDQRTVVVADHRHRTRHVDPGPHEGVDQTDRAAVVEGDDRGRQSPVDQHHVRHQVGIAVREADRDEGTHRVSDHDDRSGVRGPDHGGPLEILDGGRLGWAVDPLAPAALAEALAEAWRLPHGEADRRRSEYFPRFQGEALDANLVLVEKVREIAAAKGCTPGQHERRFPAGNRLSSRPTGRGAPAGPAQEVVGQWKLSPQAQEPVALGLSMVKPCFSMESTKSIVAPLR